MSTSKRIALITGSTDGIGQETALALLRRGFAVLLHGRSPQRVAAAVSAARTALPDAQVDGVHADLSVQSEVRALRQEVRDALARLGLPMRLDVLVNNAGVFLHQRAHTPEGVEMTLAVNHLGPFLLTHVLLPLLFVSTEGRVVHVSSVAHTRGRFDPDEFTTAAAGRPFDGYAAYAASKLANVLFSNELARRLKAGNMPISSNALHPGVISTKLLREGFGATGGSLAEGAALSVRLACDEALAGVTGRYFSGNREATAAPQARDQEAQRRLYELSARLTGTQLLPR